MKKLISTLTAALPVALIAACGSPSPSAPEPNETAAAAAPVAAPQPAAPAATPAAAPAPAAASGAVTFASLTGDATRGQAVFAQCRSCHAIQAGRNGIGPSLFGVVGRQSGSVAGYAYSSGNKNGHITWTPEVLFDYLAGPSRMVPGTKMGFILADAQRRADVIAYLETLK